MCEVVLISGMLRFRATYDSKEHQHIYLELYKYLAISNC